MKKLLLLIMTMFAMILLLGTCLRVKAPGFTTGFTFTLDEPYPLEHVYVVCGNGGTYEDILLPGGVIAEGFTVPIGESDHALEQVLGTSGLTLYAVIGTFVDGSGDPHVVLGTGADLTGVYWGDVITSDYGLTYSVLISILQSAMMPYLWNIIEHLHTDGHMSSFGTTIQLYFFSNGQPLEAYVLSNDFGDPDPPPPPNEPPVGMFTETAVTAPVGTAITFDPSGSYDPDGTIMLYEFDFDGDGTYDYSSATPNPVSHTYMTPGVFSVSMRVYDGDGGLCVVDALKTITPEQVIPEVPWGTIMASAVILCALVGYLTIPKFRKTQ